VKHLFTAAVIMAMIGITQYGHAANLDPQSENFVKKAAECSMRVVDVGRMAAKKASNEEVRKFGQQMVDDHSKVNTDLKNLATKEGIALPENVKENADQSRLDKLSGADFDHAFMNWAIQDHETAIKEFENESMNGKDEQIKTFATNTLPHLQHHLQMARDLNSRLAVGKFSSEKPISVKHEEMKPEQKSKPAQQNPSQGSY